MTPLSPTEAANRAAEILRELLGSLGDTAVRMADRGPRTRHTGGGFTIDHPRWRFAGVWKGAATTASVLGAAHELSRLPGSANSVPVVVVPFMGEAGKQICADLGVSWIDLSGNADVRGPGLRLLVEGKPSRWVRRGRPSDAFAPRSSGVARFLLMHPGTAHTKREIARATGLNEGFVGRIVEKQIELGFVVRATNGSVRVAEPGALLDAWREAYDFGRHRVVGGFTPGRTGEAVMRDLAERLGGLEIGHAATGLAAAWMYTRFAGFRLATFFVERPLSDADLAALGVRPEPRGANTWLVFPRDPSVFVGATVLDDVRCVDPIQVYLDLKAQPERSAEAARELRSRFLPPAPRGG